MIVRNRLREVELVKQLALALTTPPHHHPPLALHRETESRSLSVFNRLLQHYQHKAGERSLRRSANRSGLHQ